MEGKDVGDFEIKRIIGEGSLGPVYLAEHKFIKKLFALKFLPNTLLEDTSFRSAFVDDMSKIAALSHENLAAVHNVSTFQGQLFIVSDYIPYKSPLAMNLGTYLSTCSERLKEHEVLKILKEVAFALDYIHSQHVMSEPIVHGGLKLGNILLSEKKDGSYHIKLSDTGLVGLLGSNFVLAHMVKTLSNALESGVKSANAKRNFIQTLAFLAPEQRFSEDTKGTFKSDIYAFGVLAYFLLMGYLPEGNFALPSTVYKNSGTDWDMIVKAAMKQIPDDRPDNLTELLKRANSMVSLDQVEVPVQKAAYTYQAVQKAPPAPEPKEYKQEEEPIFAVAETPAAAKEKAEQMLRQKVERERPVQEAKEESLISISQLEQNLIGSMAKTVKARPMQFSPQGASSTAVKEEIKQQVEDPTLIFKKEKYVGTYKQEKIDTDGIKPLLTESVIIQGGFYDRGCNTGARDEKPRHKVELKTFSIDVHPVTNEQFLRFLQVMEGEKDGLNHDTILLKESRIKRQGGDITIETGYAKHPVVGVSYYGAKAYAKWIGKRLPTEAEWEAAASMGNAKNIFPFGEEIDRTRANFFSSDTTTVKSYPPSKNGLYDMCGNVYEWCEDWYDYSYYETSELEPYNPRGPKQGVYRVLRGGCWKSLVDDMRCSHRFRNNPATMNKTYGFRCVSSVESEE